MTHCTRLTGSNNSCQQHQKGIFIARNDIINTKSNTTKNAAENTEWNVSCVCLHTPSSTCRWLGRISPLQAAVLGVGTTKWWLCLCTNDLGLQHGNTEPSPGPRAWSVLFIKNKKKQRKKHYFNQVRSTHLLDCNFVYLLCFLWSILLFTDTDWSTCSCVSVFLCLLLNSIIIFCVYWFLYYQTTCALSWANKTKNN